MPSFLGDVGVLTSPGGGCIRVNERSDLILNWILASKIISWVPDVPLCTLRASGHLRTFCVRRRRVLVCSRCGLGRGGFRSLEGLVPGLLGNVLILLKYRLSGLKRVWKVGRALFYPSCLKLIGAIG